MSRLIWLKSELLTTAPSMKCRPPIEPIILVDPKDSSTDLPIKPDAYFDDVMPYARHTEKSCHLSDIIE